jgi:hypothetical protein
MSRSPLLESQHCETLKQQFCGATEWRCRNKLPTREPLSSAPAADRYGIPGDVKDFTHVSCWPIGMKGQLRITIGCFRTFSARAQPVAIVLNKSVTSS